MEKLDSNLLSFFFNTIQTLWLLFVSFLCKRKITLIEVTTGDDLLMEFCQIFEKLYGNKYTINLHLHGHLKDCILDFGPVYSFGLFAFERLNGVLGSYHTNSHDISLQLMRWLPECWIPQLAGRIQTTVPPYAKTSRVSS